MNGMLFSGPMVVKINRGLKKVTRRGIDQQPPSKDWVLRYCLESTNKDHDGKWYYARLVGGREVETSEFFKCPYTVGEIRAIRETFYAWGKFVKTGNKTKSGTDELRFEDMTIEKGHRYAYAADGAMRTAPRFVEGWHKRPSIFMPTKAVRNRVQIVSVVGARLHDMTGNDVVAEGVLDRWSCGIGNFWICMENTFGKLWDALNGKGAWKKNPMVWVVGIEKS